mgnify:FL=1
MNKLVITDTVDTQYKNPDKLNIRIRLHQLYSTNKEGFNHWIVKHYNIKKESSILELGCGTGITWKEHINLLQDCKEVYFTDLFEGMIKETRANIGEHANIHYAVVNAEELPYEDERFDIVIANMMLYHIPNLDKALKEVRRVLKKDGKFYCATYGENGVESFINQMLNIQIERQHTFTLQNGKDILENYFSSVEKLEYVDKLLVSNRSDLVEYIQSFKEMNDWQNYSEEDLYGLISDYEKQGIIEIPKEYGMFVSRK